jgi:hypothetical protein
MSSTDTGISRLRTIPLLQALILLDRYPLSRILPTGWRKLMRIPKMPGSDAGSNSPHLDDGEQQQAAQHASPAPS